MLTTKMIENLHDVAVAADRAAGGLWTASGHDVEGADGASLVDNTGFFKSEAVATYIAAASPERIVTLADRVLAHEGALRVFRAAVGALRDALETPVSVMHSYQEKTRAIESANVALLALLPPRVVEEPLPWVDNITTYYLLSKTESGIGDAEGLPLLAFRRASPCTSPFTCVLGEAEKVTAVDLQRGLGSWLTAVLCKEVDRVAMNGRVHRKHLPAIEKAAFGLSATAFVPGSST